MWPIGCVILAVALQPGLLAVLTRSPRLHAWLKHTFSVQSLCGMQNHYAMLMIVVLD